MWPKRTGVVAVSQDQVWPIDTPLPLRAQVVKGYRQGQRVRASYRVIEAGQPGPWQQVLLTEQAPGNGKPLFERLIDLPSALNRTLTGPEPGDASIEFTVEAGDDRTQVQSIQLAARPAVTRVAVELSPPVYAIGLEPAQTVALHEQPGQIASVSALTGSRVEIELGFNKPVRIDPGRLAAVLPGLGQDGGLGLIDGGLGTEQPVDSLRLGGRWMKLLKQKYRWSMTAGSTAAPNSGTVSRPSWTRPLPCR